MVEARTAVHEAGYARSGATAIVRSERSVTVVLPRPRSRYERFVKPVFDRLAAMALLVVLSPVILAVAIAVRSQLGSPVLYRQERIGRDGQPFEMFKFRTMHEDRRRQRPALPPEGVDRRKRHKTTSDPRHTALGRFLRKYSLDELPQFYNVLKGDLSLVGPRPELTDIVDRFYEDWQHARHDVKPGITGLWQVTERSDETLMVQHVDTDLRYIRDLSLRQDLRILVMTIPAVLGSRTGS